jgi:predicted phage tail protein
MRVMPFWSAGSVTLIQDKPATQTSGSYTADGEVAPVFIFSQANVVDGIFTYEGTDIKNRATFVVVRYFDIEQRKASRVQFPIKSVFDNTTIGNVSATTSAGGDIALAKYGIVKRELNAFCCTSRGQAMRLAKYTRESEQLLTETVTFTVSLDSGIFVRCGHVIGISDRVRNGDFRRAGRIKSVPTSTTDRINLDSDVTTSLYGRKTVDGTYSQSGTTVSVTTASDHYYEVGSRVTLDFTSGSAVDGSFVIATVPSSTIRS